ncbi:hypothetical protein P7J19_01025 [Streptococcus suis]|uniref:hypothetical protein n=1 Tax=Streptococcus suis TaxID=1307 RepID=UPI0038B994E3
MKVVTKKVFHDLKEDIIRFEGDAFEVTEERFKEINEKLPGFVEAVKDTPVKKSSRKKNSVEEDGQA